jgi:hypothetical protein
MLMSCADMRLLLLPLFPAAEPIIAEAEAALNSLDKGSLGELKSFGSPAAEIIQVGGTLLTAASSVSTEAAGAQPASMRLPIMSNSVPCLCSFYMVAGLLTSYNEPCIASVVPAGGCSLYDVDSSWWQDP